MLATILLCISESFKVPLVILSWIVPAGIIRWICNLNPSEIGEKLFPERKQF